MTVLGFWLVSIEKNQQKYSDDETLLLSFQIFFMKKMLPQDVLHLPKVPANFLRHICQPNIWEKRFSLSTKLWKTIGFSAMCIDTHRYRCEILCEDSLFKVE